MNKERRIKSNIPIRLIIQGYLVILICSSLIYGLIYLIDFKEIIQGRAIITSQNLPYDVYNAQAGYLRLLVKEKSVVEHGEIIGYIETDVNRSDLNSLKALLDQSDWKNTIDVHGSKLGKIAIPIQELNNHIRRHQLFLKTDQTAKLVQSKEKETNLLKHKISLLQEQGDFLVKDRKISKERNDKNDTLYSKSVISEVEAEKSKQEYFNKSFTEIGNRGTISDCEMQIEQLKQEIIEAKVLYETKKEALEAEISNAKDRLFAAIELWEQQYVLQASTSGICSLSDLMLDNDFVNQGTKILTITPKEQVGTYGIVKLPVANFSKVKEGQSVNIKFDNYPFKEYGLVEGKIQSIANLPIDEFYNVTINFPDGLVSTYNEEFEFKQMMSGTAEIITGQYSILDRVVQEWKSKRLNEKKPNEGNKNI